MPEHLQNTFLNDYVKKVDELNLIKYNERTFRKSVITPYKLMIAIANKWKWKVLEIETIYCRISVMLIKEILSKQ